MPDEWQGPERRSFSSDLTLSDVQGIQRTLDSVLRELQANRETLGQFAPRHEIDDKIVAVEHTIEVVEDAAANAHTAAKLAASAALGLRRQAEHQLRQAQRAGIFIIYTVASTVALTVLLAMVLIEEHTHRGHLSHIEDVNNAILSEAGNETVVDYGSSLPPLFPPAGQEGFLFGPWIYIIFISIFLFTALQAIRFRRKYLRGNGFSGAISSTTTTLTTTRTTTEETDK